MKNFSLSASRGFSKVWLIVLIVIVVAGLWLVFAYNGLVSTNEGVDTQWAQVEAQYQRRFDLIPNLVESVKGIMQQEQEVFGQIAEARSQYAGARTVDEKAAAAGQMESALGRLLVITENYPQLRSSETVSTLMAQLEGTENRVSVERNRFNELVRTYNLKVKRVPNNILASLFGFDERAYFEAAAGAEIVPQVKI
ncbi:MAG: LemA family protein [Candidatus Taylorbacteria bacterium RIFCSPHIGHO2_01_FULL_46_22b]|uniref:LemA family protein n=1 Tax=Candidatus Taylorbacteria bacterium RIFCSPHIGHO2_01_FULL_46_22b TaxID=1802301 RepID=A0A1G2M3U8_9BACT|nr:MAG: LemA family protein [Candidatus Taylorbacteria bacterium RIFCSPHIGHO2_01_FULL_46_22b]